jgi:hypothetical protein
LIQWANGQAPWVRVLVAAVLEEQGPIESGVIDESFETLLRANGLRDDAASVDVPMLVDDAPSVEEDASMTLDRLRDVEGVNALAASQTVEFDHNLTVLFGQNGSGKTGYARIIKRAAGARSPENILGNMASAETSPKPAACFDLTVDGTPQTVDWSNDVGLAPLTRIRVFDSQTATLHVDNDLGYIFTPAELARFTDVTDAISAVQERVTSEQAERQKSSCLSPNPFTAGTRVHELVQGLGPETSFAELKDLANLQDDPEKRLQNMQAEYASLASGPDETQKVGLKRQLDDLTDLKRILSALESFDAASFNEVLARVAEARSAVNELRTTLVDTEHQAADPGDAWQDFIEAGQAYAEHLGFSQYPQEGDVCLYCRQPLESEALSLLRKYGDFLTGAAQAQLQVQLQTLEGSIPPLALAQIQSSRSALSNVEDDSDPRQLAERLLADAEGAWQLIENRHACTYPDLAQRSSDLKSPIQDLHDRLVSEKQALENKEKDQGQVLPDMQREIQELGDRIKLSTHLDQIKGCVANAKAAQRLGELDQEISNRVRRSLSREANRASQELANQDFELRFNEECAALDAPTVTLDFQGRQGSAQRKKRVFNHRPSEILSEGEQKVLALADFLAESRMHNSKHPIVFDDPVSSLDYRRLEKVAARLAQLAEEQQVIVLTHNIMFAAELLSHRQSNGKRTHFMEVRDSGTEKGIVAPDVEPRLDKPPKLAKRVEEAISQASQAVPSSQNALIAHAYSLIRSWCEAFAEQELLGNVSQRYRANIMMTLLDKIKVERLSDAIAVLSPAFGRICRYIDGHSHPHEQSNVRRTAAELQQDWAELMKMRDQYQAP